MAWVTPTNVATGDVLTAATWNQSVVANATELAPFFGAWSTFTPTLSNGWANGNATTTGRYIKVGRFVAFYAQIVLGSTTTKAAATMQLSLPVTAATFPLTGNQNSNFQCTLLDSATAAYPGVIEVFSTTTVNIYAIGAGSTYANYAGATNLVPFTWGTNDSVAYSGFYEAAS